MKITIITSTYNCVADLPKTIESIRSQTHNNIQYIVADGASTDGTLEIIKNNTDVITDYFSKPDSGIYDAWNKAAPLIKGEWVIFLGAGDYFVSDDVLDKVVLYLDEINLNHYKLVYGNHCCVDKNGKKFLVTNKVVDLTCLKKNRCPRLPCHQTIFHHVSLFSKIECFPSTYQIIGECYMLYQTIKFYKIKHIPIMLTCFLVPGKSSSPENGLRKIKELNLLYNDLKKINLKLSRLSSYNLYINYILYVCLGRKLWGRCYNFYYWFKGRPMLW